MFKFKPTRKTYSDPIAATFKPGIPLGRKYSAGDMCLLHDGFQGSKVFLNSRVLRSALLNSKEYVEEVLEIRITDIRDNEPKEVKDMEVVEADLAKGDVPKSGDELILDSEDLIVGNTDIETSDLEFPEIPVAMGQPGDDKGEITEEVIIEGVNEIPEGAEVVDEVVIEAPVEKKTKKTSKK